MKPLVEEAKPNIVVLDLSGVPDLEIHGAEDAHRGSEAPARSGVMDCGPQSGSAKDGPALSSWWCSRREGMHFNVETAVAKYSEVVGRSTAEL